MIRVHILACDLKSDIADRLNRESGRIYTQVMIEHYRIYRKHAIWLKSGTAERINDNYNQESPSILHAHSIDAAQQGFYEACKTAKANKKDGVENAKYPHWQKEFRSTTWKKSGIRIKDGLMYLSLGRGNGPIKVDIRENLLKLDIRQVELVYNKSSRKYRWHITIDDNLAPAPTQGLNSMAGDLGEIHPCALSDGQTTTIISCRELRSVKQYTHKRLAELRKKQSRCLKHSRNWWQLQRRINKFLAKQQLRTSDLEHKITHEIIEVAKESNVKEIALGNVRDIADGKHLNKKSQQKISTWSHGKIRIYINYKAQAAGIEVVDDINEAYTSQTCPTCENRYKPQGRIYHCPVCGLMTHRDGVGAVNILSKHVFGEVGKIPVPILTKYRYPFLKGKRSPSVTGQVARNCSLTLP